MTYGVPSTGTGLQIACFHGAEQDDITPRELERWSELLSGVVRAHLLAGGHFLLDTCEARVLETIARVLAD